MKRKISFITFLTHLMNDNHQIKLHIFQVKLHDAHHGAFSFWLNLKFSAYQSAESENLTFFFRKGKRKST